IMVVVAYLLLSTNKIKPGLTYQLLNLIASLLMAIALLPKDAWFSFALQAVWGIIALVAIFTICSKSLNHKRNTSNHKRPSSKKR
ncbi:hypothetical protein IJH74_02635, partial [Candidatus Saccharibacteria bacterium]|nr:hypothetical protein [Candidatus Saccharibacteria bacterium]